VAPISVLIADPDPEFSAEVSQELSRAGMILAGACEQPEQVRDLAARVEPGVLLLGPGCDSDSLMPLAQDMLSVFGELGVVVVSAKIVADFLHDALAVGIHDVLEVPVDADQLLNSIRRAHDLARGQAGVTKSLEMPASPCRVITIFSTKGGVGKTVIATNLAVALARQNARVAIIDLDLQFGDVGVMYQLEPSHTIHDAVELGPEPTRHMIEPLLAKHSTGVHALLAPAEPELADLIAPSTVIGVIEALKASHEYVVIDTPPSFNDHVLTVLDRSDAVCLVATMDIPAIKNVKLCVATMRLLGYPAEKTCLVLNRTERHVGLHPDEIEQTVGMKISASLPADRAVPLSINKGVPLVEDAPRSAVSKGIVSLAGRLSAVPGGAAVTVG
jgi:pilus assembly protein CpaE